MPIRLTLSGDIRALFRKATIKHVLEWSEYRNIAPKPPSPQAPKPPSPKPQVPKSLSP